MHQSHKINILGYFFRYPIVSGQDIQHVFGVVTETALDGDISCVTINLKVGRVLEEIVGDVTGGSWKHKSSGTFANVLFLHLLVYYCIYSDTNTFCIISILIV